MLVGVEALDPRMVGVLDLDVPEGAANHCPDAAVTPGELVLMPVRVETLGPDMAVVLDQCGTANLCDDVATVLVVLVLGVLLILRVPVLGAAEYLGPELDASVLEPGLAVVTEPLVLMAVADGEADDENLDNESDDDDDGRNAG